MGALKAIAVVAVAGAFAHPAALLSSRQLWATVDVCNPADQPNTIGVRGSMPGDGHAKDSMYMRFGVQYFDPATKQWVRISKGADSGFLKVGSAHLTRQSGWSFQFARLASKPAYALRGSVVFQWRRGAKLLATTTRITSAGHRSLAGADPPGFSAATCKLG